MSARACVMLVAAATGCSPPPVADDTGPLDDSASHTDDTVDPPDTDVHSDAGPCPALPGRLRDCWGTSGLSMGRRAVPWFPVAVEQHLVPGDLDGDGLPDLIATEFLGPVRIWRNEGDLTFLDVTEAWGIDLQGAWGADVADLDGDGDLDLIVTSVDLPARARIWLDGGTTDADLEVFENVGGRFEERTDAWGFGAPVTCIDRCLFVGATFLDLNDDGILDVFPTHHVSEKQPGVVYLSDGPGRWVRDDAFFGMVIGETYAAIFSDFDNDGPFDLLPVLNHNTSLTSIPRFYRKLPRGFVERQIGSAFFGTNPETSTFTAASVSDVDHDGDLDIAFADYRMVLLLRNQGNGTFTDEILATDQPSQAIVWFDHDGDGWDDLWSFPGVNEREPLPNGRLRLWKNREGGLVEETPPYAEPELAPVVGTALSDLDRDGRPDLILGGAQARPRVLRNGFEGTWLSIALRTDGRSPEGIGARVEVFLGDRSGLRDMREDGSPGTTSEAVLHFGLAGASRVDRVRVTWPWGEVEVFTDVPSGHQILEAGRGTLETPP